MVGDKMNFNNIRSDLAGESLDQLESGKHYNKEEYVNDGIKVEKITILKEHQSINQGIGTYVEISPVFRSSHHESLEVYKVVI
ncbi:hypothetical protein [Thomasclavelia spiroformis]|uniref:hypothetical protein n=1 Tax=Thomasclavelia spiroformis TaxID=29348 RepID=UPI001F150AF9|nr:hypothetical protein [Thomasclavelia spiroformis]